MSELDPESLRIIQNFAQYANGLLDAGQSPSQVAGALMVKGFDYDSATTFVEVVLEKRKSSDAGIAPSTTDQSRNPEVEAVVAKLVNYADSLYHDGASQQQVQNKLVEAGVDADSANQIATQRREAFIKFQNSPGIIFLGFLGMFTFVAGCVLAFGNLTGYFPTFPYAGLIFTVIGVILCGIAGIRIGD